MTSDISSLTLCPINFKAFDRINSQLKNVEATLLYSKIKFHQTHTKIKKENQLCIARSREQMASWFNFGLKKIDRLLALLERHGLIQKTLGTWYGKKRLFISASNTVDQSPINIKILESLTQQTASIKSSLVYSKIAFGFANTKIQHESLRWCTINKQDLATWASCSIRTIDSLLQNLIKSGLILKKNFIYRDKLQSHFHIPTHVIESLKVNTKENIKSEIEDFLFQNNGCVRVKADKTAVHNPITHSQICRPQPAKTISSIRIRSKEKKTNNTTSKIVLTKTPGQGEITFSTLGTELSIRQLKYLEAALSRTIERRKIRISNPKELWHQLKFALLNPQQHLKTVSYQHAVSRFMKIIGDGNWKTPIGFHKHSDIGRQFKTEQNTKLEQWQLQKEQECQQAKDLYQYLRQKNNRMFYQQNQVSTIITDQAMQLAKQIRYLAETGENQLKPEAIHCFESMNKQLHGYLRQGADKTQILACLRG